MQETLEDACTYIRDGCDADGVQRPFYELVLQLCMRICSASGCRNVL